MKIERLFDFFYKQLKEYPLERAFNNVEDNKITYFSTEELLKQAEQLASGLIGLGLKKDDKVAIVSYKNRAEWIIADLACQIIGVISVPLYPTISYNEYEYILNEANVKYAIAGGGDLYDKLKKAQESVPTLTEIFVMDKTPGKTHYKDIFSMDYADEVQKRRDSIRGDDLATIIYTSGTTGVPKGVMLTHKNIIWAVIHTLSSFPLKAEFRTLSFLPFSHVFERACIYGYADANVEVYCTSTDNIADDLQSIKPHFFTTVPRLLEKVYEKILNKGLQLTGLKKKLFFWALKLTKDFEFGVSYTGLTAVKQNIASKLIFSKWKEALGGHIVGIVTGAAPCPRKIAQVFSAAGIPIMEGYGLSETAPTLTINRFNGAKKLGTVGVPIHGVELYIDSSEGEYKDGEGEVLAIGPNVMLGYYKQPEKTDAVFKTIDGIKYFRTGDIGKIIKDGDNEFLTITDRKKELLKTSGGKYVAPAPIEGKLRENLYVEQAMVVGNNKKFVSGLIVPNKESITEWAKEHNISFDKYEELMENPKVIKHYQKIIDKVNANVSHIEKIKKFKLLSQEWEAVKTDNTEAELTPTLKLKRRVVREKFSKEIDQLYAT